MPPKDRNWLIVISYIENNTLNQISWVGKTVYMVNSCHAWLKNDMAMSCLKGDMVVSLKFMRV